MSLIEMRMAIIVGHTFDRPGSMGVAPLNQREYNYNLDLSNVIYRYARESGINARVFLRDDRTLEKTYDEVNAWCKDQNAVAIELHFNSCSKEQRGKARGTETLWDDDPSSSLEFARMVHDDVCSVFNRTGKMNRGLKKIINPDERGYANLRLMKIPGCIVEPFFGDNTDDALLGHVKSWEYAKALVTASFKFMIQKESESPLLGSM